jgi:hypothetical protein
LVMRQGAVATPVPREHPQEGLWTTVRPAAVLRAKMRVTTR